MKKLIRKILKEQEEDKPPIPIYKKETVFNYLDLKLNDLHEREAINFRGTVFVTKTKSIYDREYGVLGYGMYTNNLYLTKKLIDEISSKFRLDENRFDEIIIEWFSNKFKKEVSEVQMESKIYLLGKSSEETVNGYLFNFINTLETRASNDFEGIVLAPRDKPFGVLGFSDDRILYIFTELIENISNEFGVDFNLVTNLLVNFIAVTEGPVEDIKLSSTTLN